MEHARDWCGLMALLFAAVLAALGAARAAGGSPPNIVLIVADDVGFHDLGYQNPEVETPSIDQLAVEGVVLDRFYTAPLCSPARMALLTGRYPIRWGMQRRTVTSWELKGIPPVEETLPEMLAAGGFTPGLAGKWHLGHAFSKFHPQRHGFDEFLGNYTGMVDYYTHERMGELDWREGTTSRPEDGGIYHTELVGDAAVAFLEAQADSGPFFLYLTFQAAHTPKQAPQDLIDYYLGQGLPETRAIHLAQITAMDLEIGRVLAALDAAAVRDDTVVWFFADNGGKLNVGADNGPLRGEKGTVYEGGIRTPSVLRYPDGELPVGAVIETLVSVVDVVPTLRGMLEASGLELEPARNPFDGIDLLPVLQGGAMAPDREHYSFVSVFDDGAEDYSVVSFTAGAVGWKLVWMGSDFELPPPPATSIELYDLGADPGETLDLAATNPAVVEELLGELDSWRDQRPAEGGFSGNDKPVGWQPQPEWNFLDQPVPCASSYMLYRSSVPPRPQLLGVLQSDASIAELGSVAGEPDGSEDLILQGLGLNPVDGRLYAIDEQGTFLYQLDSTGLVMRFGPVSGVVGPVRFSAGDVHPGGVFYYAFDDRDDRLFSIELSGLIAVEVPLVGQVPSGNLRIEDMVFDSGGDLLVYESNGRRVYRIAPDGQTSRLPFLFELGRTGASWVDGDDDLLLYKDANDGFAQGAGLYHLDLTTGAVTLLAPGDPRTRIDGASCGLPPTPLP